MIKKGIILVIILLFVGTTFIPTINGNVGNQQSFISNLSDNEFDKKIEELMEKAHMPSLVACIVKNNTIMWKNAYGYYKYYTKNCDGCKWYRNIEDEDLCGWGIYFKYLIKPKELRKCRLRNKNRRGNHSVEYLDQLVKENKTIASQ